MSNGRVVPVARSSGGTGHVNTVVVKPPTSFAMMELLNPTDTKTMRNKWRGYGFRDVTPLWADKGVQTFNDGKLVPRWPAFQAQFSKLDADWYYLSGHHAQGFATEVEEVDAHMDNHRHVGFFNEVYHHGRWLEADAGQPDRGAHAGDLFVTTSTEAPVGPLGNFDNPLYTHARPSCKGLILMACNTLSYRVVRERLATFFPNALIVGYVDRTPANDDALTPILKCCGRGFFEKPPSDAKSLVDLVREMNRKYVRKGTLALQIKTRLYMSNKACTRATPLDFRCSYADIRDAYLA